MRGRLVWSGSTRVRCHSLVDTPLALADGDDTAVATRLRRDGYLLLRGFLERGEVLDARQAIFDEVGQEDVASASTMPSLLARQDIAALPAVRQVLESARVADLLQRASGAVAPLYRPLPFKWLRAVQPGLFTGVHFDRVYFPTIDAETYTAWVPLGDVPVEHGAMMVCEGAHRFGHPRFDELRRCYLVGKESAGTRANGNGTDHGWYSEDAAQVVRDCGPGCRWLTSDLRCVLKYHHTRYKSVVSCPGLLWGLSRRVYTL
jgi:hypothetical protein